VSTQELLRRVAENMSVRRAFGPAYERDDLLVIPVALVIGGGGGGGGAPTSSSIPPAEEASATADGAAEGEGGQPTRSGGGFGGVVLPMGVYVVNAGQVRWVPVIDVTVLTLASLSALRVLAALRGRSRRRHHD